MGTSVFLHVVGEGLAYIYIHVYRYVDICVYVYVYMYICSLCKKPPAALARPVAERASPHSAASGRFWLKSARRGAGAVGAQKTSFKGKHRGNMYMCVYIYTYTSYYK